MIVQERRRLEMQQAAEAEAASKAKASLLRQNIRKANQKVLLEGDRLKAEGKATREAASHALLAAVRCQHSQTVIDESEVTCSATSAQGVSGELSDVSNGQRGGGMCAMSSVPREWEYPRQRLTADDILNRQGRGSPSLIPKVRSARGLCATWALCLSQYKGKLCCWAGGNTRA